MALAEVAANWLRRADSDSQVLLLHLGLLDPEDAAAAWKQIDPWFESGNWPFPFGFEGAEVCHGPMYGLHLDSSVSYTHLTLPTILRV